MALQYAAVTPQAYYVHEKTNLDFLDDILDKLLRGNVDIGMVELGNKLYELYASTSDNEWEYLLNNHLLKHPIKDVLMQDPLTARAFNRPRGYAGDAALLDMIYFPGKMDFSNVTSLGRQLYNYTAKTSVCRTLTKRVRLVSSYIDKVAEQKPNARALSVACGHCREAEFSKAIQNNELAELVALDNDNASLELVKQEYGSFRINQAHLSVADLIKGRNNFGKFDLIYSAGLYDYLGKRFAQKLTAQLYNMLAPQGKLILINIAPDYDEIGFVESYMSWAMIGRGKTELLELASDLSSNEHATLNVKDDSLLFSHFHILEIEKNRV